MAANYGLGLKRPSAIPGFGLALGFTLTYLSLIVLIPLAALVLKSATLGIAGFWEVVTGPRTLAALRLSFLTSLFAADRHKRVGAALGLVGLSDRGKHKPRELSGGQEQRVGIARAIVSDPTLLLCDEPTGDLDRKSGDEILDLLQALNQQQNKTIIMVTHDPHAAARAKHVLHLNKGQLTTEAVA